MLSFLPSHGRQNNTSRCKVPFHMQWVYSCIIHCSDDSSSESEDPSLSAAVVYETPAAIYSAETIMKILLNPTSSRVSRVCPHCVTKSSTYVVDVTSLAHPEDVKKDDFRKWDYKGSHPVAFHVCFKNDGSISIKRCQNEERQGDIFLPVVTLLDPPIQSRNEKDACIITGMLNLPSVMFQQPAAYLYVFFFLLCPRLYKPFPPTSQWI